MEIGGCKIKSRSWQFPALLVWLVASLGVPYQFILQSTPNLMIPFLMHDLHISQAQIGFLTSSFFYTYLFFQIPAGLVIDRFGVRKVLSLSLFLAAIASFLFANAHGFVMGNMSRMMMGLVTAPCVPAILSVACQRFSATYFVILAGLSESIGMFGGAVGEAALGGIVTSIGWRNTLLLYACLGLILSYLMYFILRGEKTSPSAAIQQQKFSQILRGFLTAMKSSQIWLIVWYAGLVFALIPALAGLWIVQVLQNLYGLKLSIAVLGSSMIFLGTALGLPFWGWWSEKIGRRKPVLLLATGLALLFMAIFVYLPGISLTMAFVTLVLIGFFCAVYVLAFALVREQTAGQIRGSAMGLTNMMCMIIGAPLLQPLMGCILDHVSPRSVAYHHALSIIMICLVLAFIMIFFIRETYCKSNRS